MIGGFKAISEKLRCTLTTPCKSCYLRNDELAFMSSQRAEQFVHKLIKGLPLECRRYEGQHCAGAIIYLERFGLRNSAMREARNRGGYDPALLDTDPPLFSTLTKWATTVGATYESVIDDIDAYRERVWGSKKAADPAVSYGGPVEKPE